MSRKTAVIVFVMSLFLMSGISFAQSNEIGILVGGTLSPNSDPVGGVTCIFNDANCAVPNHTSSQISYEGVIAHRIENLHLASFSIELPVVGIPNRTVRHAILPQGGTNVFQSFSSIFFTPGLRVKLAVPGISPFLTVGGGFAHFSSDTSSMGAAGSSSTTGAFQVGGGVDLNTPIPHIGLRGEVREFYTGFPSALSVGASRHNIFIGGGLVLHF